MKVVCRLCAYFENGKCMVRKTGGKHPRVSPNKRRTCSKFVVNPQEAIAEAEREAARRAMPICVPTWRFYADKDELKIADEIAGPKFIKVTPDQMRFIKKEG